MQDVVGRGKPRVVTDGKPAMRGVVPPSFYTPPDDHPYRTFSTTTLADLLWRSAMEWLGVARHRLHILLGGNPTTAWDTGNRWGLSQEKLGRLSYLFLLKGRYRYDISAIYAIDWKEGVVYLNEGQQLRSTSEPKAEVPKAVKQRPDRPSSPRAFVNRRGRGNNCGLHKVQPAAD